jgi:oleate hydratase
LVLEGKETTIDLTPNDLLFITNGSCVENSDLGDHSHPAKINTNPGDS